MTATPTLTRLDPPYRFDWDDQRANPSPTLDYHRNGVSGTGFVVELTDTDLIVRFADEDDDEGGRYGIEVAVPLSYVRPPSDDIEIVFESADIAVAVFHDNGVGDMVGILVNDGHDLDGIPCAVFDQDALLARRTVQFGINSYRGDRYAHRIIDALARKATGCTVCGEPLDDDVVCDGDGSTVRHTRCDYLTFEVGERVVSKGGSLGLVLAQVGEWVWVRWEGDSVPKSHPAIDLRPYVTGGVLTETWQVWTTDGNVLVYRHEATGVTEARRNTDTVGLLHVMPDGTTEYTPKALLDTRYPAVQTA